MTTPTISVIMSVYNAEKFLHLAIDSILTQSFSDFEFIIIEDCSTDKSLEIIENFQKKDSRIKIIKKEKNKGTEGFIENLNLGLQNATGKYIARMDADDISNLNRLQLQYEFLEKNPDIFIVGAQLNMMNEDGKIMGEKLAELTHEKIYEKMPKIIQLFHPVLMFRNSELRYRNNMWFCEDYELYLRLMTDGKKMANLPDKLLQYRVLNSSISRNQNKLVRRLFLEKAFQFYEERKKTGKDSYDTFTTESLMKITDNNYPSSFEDLELAAKTCIKNNYKEPLKIIVEKTSNRYPNKNILRYKIATLLPNFLFPYFAKFSKQLS